MKCCNACKQKSNSYIRNLKGTKANTSKYHYVIVAITLALVSMFFVHDVAEDGNKFIFYQPQASDLKRKPSTFLSTIEFSQDTVKDRMQNMAYQMDYSCEVSVTDVIFSFQYVRSTITNETYNDHIFMVCRNHMAFSNAEVVYESKEKIMCTEEYAGKLQRKIRSQNISIKAIDVQKWEPIDYSSATEQEACTLAHGIEMLNNKWAV
jgi:hypothetical protein